MAANKIHLLNAFGKSVPFDTEKIKNALVGNGAGDPDMWGEAHVWAEDSMIYIAKERDTKRGPFYHTVCELEEVQIPKAKVRDQNSKLIEILEIKFKADELDEAIKIFISLCKKPKKVLRRKLIERMGNHAIFLHNIATKNPNL